MNIIFILSQNSHWTRLS